MSVTRPFVYNVKATYRKAVVIIVIIWLTSAAVVLPSAIARTIEPIEIFATFGVVYFELISMICYAKVRLVARRVRRQIRADEGRFINVLSRKRESRLICTICLIVLSFVCCYIPFQLLCVFYLAQIQGIPSYFLYWSWTIANTNALINPLITCWQLSAIRNGILSLWRRRANENVTAVTVKSSWTNRTINE